MLAKSVRLYAERAAERDGALPAFAPDAATATEVMVTVTAMLKAVNLQVFELGMWQAWSGKRMIMRKGNSMDLPLSDFRRMEVEEFDTSKLLAHASKQAAERGYKNFPIIDVDSHHYESEFDRRNPRIHGRSGAAAACAQCASGKCEKCRHVAGRRRLPGHGWPRHALRNPGHGKNGKRRAARHCADAAMDGCDRHRRRGDVPDANASARTAPAGRGRGRAGACLQSLAQRTGAGARAAHPLDALSAVQRRGRRLPHRSGIRTDQRRCRLHGDVGALSPGPPQFLHEDLCVFSRR